MALVVLALIATMFAALSHWFTLRRLRRGKQPVVGQWPLSITVALLLACLCIVGLWGLYGS